MTKLITIMILIFFLSIAQHAFGEGVCEQSPALKKIFVGDNESCKTHRDFLNHQVAAGFDRNTAINMIAGSKAPLIVLAEEHYSDASAGYSDLISDLKNHDGKINCLLLEAGANSRSEIKEIIRTESSGKVQILQSSLADAVLTSNKLGIKIFPVDLAQKMESYQDYQWDVSSAGIDKRNRAMAAEISRLTRNRDCSRMIFIVGKAHVSDLLKGKTVVQYLRAAGINSFSVNIMTTGSAMMSSDTSFRWATCTEGPIAPGETVGFTYNGKLSVPLFPADNSRYNDFQLTLIFPSSIHIEHR